MAVAADADTAVTEVMEAIEAVTEATEATEAAMAVTEAMEVIAAMAATEAMEVIAAEIATALLVSAPSSTSHRALRRSLTVLHLLRAARVLPRASLRSQSPIPSVVRSPERRC